MFYAKKYKYSELNIKGILNYFSTENNLPGEGKTTPFISS